MTRPANRAPRKSAAGVSSKGQVDIPVIAVDIPVMFEDDGQEEMGDADVHTITCTILYTALKVHLATRPQYHVFSDLDVLYHPIKRRAYVSPDVIVVRPTRQLPANPKSYRVGFHGPGPVLTVEVLSKRSAQQQDLTNKLDIYSSIKVREYILVDVTGEFLPEKLVLKRRRPNGRWLDSRDADGGVTSRLGFRIVMEPDGQVRVIDQRANRPYPRPLETLARLPKMEAELARLRQQLRQRPGQ
jgi:Uma2 family endonuclease